MKKCLITVDYQNDFVCGSLGFDGAVKIENAIAEKIKEYREAKAQIIFTFDSHSKDYMDTREGRFLPVFHCIEGSDGRELYGKIKDLCKDGDLRFYKNTFGSAELFDYLKNSDFDEIELAGVVSNICVISNAVLAKTALPEASIIVDARCVASNSDELNKAALDVMRSLQIIIKGDENS